MTALNKHQSLNTGKQLLKIGLGFLPTQMCLALLPSVIQNDKTQVVYLMLHLHASLITV